MRLVAQPPGGRSGDPADPSGRGRQAGRSGRSGRRRPARDLRLSTSEWNRKARARPRRRRPDRGAFPAWPSPIAPEEGRRRPDRERALPVRRRARLRRGINGGSRSMARHPGGAHRHRDDPATRPRARLIAEDERSLRPRGSASPGRHLGGGGRKPGRSEEAAGPGPPTGSPAGTRRRKARAADRIGSSNTARCIPRGPVSASRAHRPANRRLGAGPGGPPPRSPDARNRLEPRRARGSPASGGRRPLRRAGSSSGPSCGTWTRERKPPGRLDRRGCLRSGWQPDRDRTFSLDLRAYPAREPDTSRFFTPSGRSRSPETRVSRPRSESGTACGVRSRRSARPPMGPSSPKPERRRAAVISSPENI